MKRARRQRSSRPTPSGELAELRARLAEAQETISAIRNGEVDAVLISSKFGPRVFTLEGAEHPYRVLMESMNEGALTLTPNGVILYANRCFAGMVKSPLEQVVGSSFRRFLSVADREMLRSLLKGASESGSKIQVVLHGGDASQTPAQISIRSLPTQGSNSAITGMVVTDMTQSQRNEEKLRKLAHLLMRTQEAERSGVALELHDHITQLLCAVLVRSQALADKLSKDDGPSKKEAIELRKMLGTTAAAVERVSRNLRPSVLDELGLLAALRDLCREFTARTGVPVNLACVRLSAVLSAEVELTLYRIAQKALDNVEKYARARHVTMRLKQPGGFVQLTIKDDGIGFNLAQPVNGKESAGIGLLRMRERAISADGTFNVKSARRAGTEIEVRIPLPPRATAANQTHI